MGQGGKKKIVNLIFFLWTRKRNSTVGNRIISTPQNRYSR